MTEHRPASGDDRAASSGFAASVLDTLRWGIVIHDRQLEVVYSNAAAEEVLGLSRAQLRGRAGLDPAWSTCDEQGGPIAPDELPLVRCFASGAPVRDFIMGVRRPDGDLSWIRLEAHPLPDGAGQVAQVVLVFEDVTRERAVAAELSRSEARLSMIRAAGGVGLWEWDLRSNELWHDDQFRQVTRCTVPDADAWLRVVHPGDRDRVAMAMGALAAEPGRRELTYRMIDAEGVVRWIAVTAEAVGVEEGRATHIAGSLADVTALRLASRQVQHLLDSMTDGYFSLTPDWRVSYVNDQALVFLQRTREELEGAHLWSTFPDAVGTDFQAHYERAMAGEHVEFEAFYPGLDAWYEVRAHPVTDHGIAVYFRDVTQRRRDSAERERLLAEAQRAKADLAHAAAHDPLTSLPNRAALAEWLAARFAGGRRRTPLSVLFIDIDRFKLVNDSFGHGYGDELLRQVGARLAANLRGGDFVARVGGDEFIIAVEREEPEVAALAGRVKDAFELPFRIGANEFVVTASVGAATAKPGANPETLIRDADAALYGAKDAGRNRVVQFDRSMHDAVVRRVCVEADLREALRAGGIRPHFQPIFDAATGALSGCEALSRWEGSGVTPGEFIPIAEETGLIQELDRTVLEGVRHAAPELAALAADLRIWVNVAPRQLLDRSYAPGLIDWAAAHGMTGTLGLEITETALVEGPGAIDALHQLAAAGFTIAIDDFGTGFSSLARLAHYPVHMLKIDRSFVEQVEEKRGRDVVAAVVQLAHALGAQACAEGVENAVQLEVLRELGVDKMSGFYLAAPVPVDRFAAAAAHGTDAHGGAGR